MDESLKTYAEYFRDFPVSRKLLLNCAQTDYLNKICSKFHFMEYESEKKALWDTAQKMREPMLEEAAFSFRPVPDQDNPPMAAVVVTLGSGIDLLQEEYTKAGLLSESYMVEAIAGEILLDSYQICNERLNALTRMHVARYYFLGESPCELKEIPQILQESGLKVKCNPACYLIPQKSVVFYAALSQDERAVCPGICMGCSNENCPNRTERENHALLREADLAAVAFNYGYARIFGKKF